MVFFADTIKSMRNQVNLGQAIGFAITLIGAVIVGWTSIQTRLSVQEEKVNRLDAATTENTAAIEKATDGMMEIRSDIKLIIYKIDRLSDKESNK
jgi:hypothetical protein